MKKIPAHLLDVPFYVDGYLYKIEKSPNDTDFPYYISKKECGLFCFCWLIDHVTTASFTVAPRILGEFTKVYMSFKKIEMLINKTQTEPA